MIPAQAITAVVRPPIRGVRTGTPVKAMAGNPNDRASNAVAAASRRKTNLATP